MDLGIGAAALEWADGRINLSHLTLADSSDAACLRDWSLCDIAICVVEEEGADDLEGASVFVIAGMLDCWNAGLLDCWIGHRKTGINTRVTKRRFWLLMYRDR